MAEFLTDEELKDGEPFCSHCAASSNDIRRAEYRTKWRSRFMRASAYWYACEEHMPLDRDYFLGYADSDAECIKLDLRWPESVVWATQLDATKAGVL